MEKLAQIWKKAKPYLGALVVRLCVAGFVIISKIALNQGMNTQVFLVYRYSIAAIVIAPLAFIFDRKRRPKMTLPIFARIMLLGSVETTLNQNVYYAALNCVTPTTSVAIYNALPVISFLMAWIFRLEKVNIRRWQSQAKLTGTAVTVGGATIFTLTRGPMLSLPWTKGDFNHQSSSAANKQNSIKGVLMIIVSCVCASASKILQGIALKSYPVGLSLTVLVCLVGVVEGTILALAMEWNNSAAWSLHLDATLLSLLYTGIIYSGISYYVQGVVVKEKGPVFLTAFTPLSMIIIVIISSFVFSEILYLGRVIGAVFIIIGLYLVLWGKSKDPIDIADDKEASSDNKVDATNERLETTSQELRAVDVARVRTKDDSV